MPTSIHAITRLRQYCVDTHNGIDWVGGQPLLPDVCRALEVPLDIEPRSPAHKLLSSYGFFSDEYLIVGRRRTFDDRLHRTADDRSCALLKTLRNRPFGAWQVRDRSVSDETVTAVCESVALDAAPDGRIEIDDRPGPGTQARRADDTYWLRHRWRVLMSHFHDNLDHYDDRYGLAHLKPDYAGLRRILHELFDDVLGDLPITELPHDPRGQLSYVAEALTDAGLADNPPPRLRDLPTAPLDEVPGIGHKRADLVYQNLDELLIN